MIGFFHRRYWDLLVSAPGAEIDAKTIERNRDDDGEADNDESIFLREPQDDDAVLDQGNHQRSEKCASHRPHATEDDTHPNVKSDQWYELFRRDEGDKVSVKRTGNACQRRSQHEDANLVASRVFADSRDRWLVVPDGTQQPAKRTFL